MEHSNHPRDGTRKEGLRTGGLKIHFGIKSFGRIGRGFNSETIKVAQGGRLASEADKSACQEHKEAAHKSFSTLTHQGKNLIVPFEWTFVKYGSYGGTLPPTWSLTVRHGRACSSKMKPSGGVSVFRESICCGLVDRFSKC